MLASNSTELRPKVFSRRYFEVLLLALGNAPRLTLSALFALLRAKKLRSWNLLCKAAMDNPRCYTRWIALTEPGVIARCSASAAGHAPMPAPIIALIIGEPDSEAAVLSKNSVQAALASSAEVVLAKVDQIDIALLRRLLERTPDAWLFPLPAGDLISRHLAKMVKPAGSASHHLVYWDEDRIENCQRCDPWVKPEWDALMLAAQGGLVGSSMLRGTTLLSALDSQLLPGTSAEMIEALCLALGTQGASHIPAILTHRSGPARTVKSTSMQEPPVWPMVSIIVPTRDLPEHLTRCVAGLDSLNYPGLVELIVVDNGTADPQALRILDDLGRRPATRLLRIPGPFNFSTLNNAAVEVALGDVLCLLNNDVEPLDGDWLKSMVSHAVQPKVGAVGALLLYPDGTIQHAGVAIGLGSAAGHVQKGVSPDSAAHRFWSVATRRVSAVTAACLVICRDRYLSVGGFDEAAFAVAFNDVDLCLKLDRSGWENRIVAEARLIHHESKSRGLDDRSEKRLRFAGELERLERRWQTTTCNDSWYSPLLSRASEQCLLRM